MSTLADVLSYGPILAIDEELGCLVTGNGSYFNLWAPDGNGTYTNTTCTTIPDGDGDGMYGHSAADFWDAGKIALKQFLNPTDD